jgi:hypothetical protein
MEAVTFLGSADFEVLESVVERTADSDYYLGVAVGVLLFALCTS